MDVMREQAMQNHAKLVKIPMQMGRVFVNQKPLISFKTQRREGWDRRWQKLNFEDFKRLMKKAQNDGERLPISQLKSKTNLGIVSKII
jgi:hypothetical protein